VEKSLVVCGILLKGRQADSMEEVMIHARNVRGNDSGTHRILGG
jgi:hypothetical protein